MLDVFLAVLALALVDAAGRAGVAAVQQAFVQAVFGQADAVWPPVFVPEASGRVDAAAQKFSGLMAVVQVVSAAVLVDVAQAAFLKTVSVSSLDY